MSDGFRAHRAPTMRHGRIVITPTMRHRRLATALIALALAAAPARVASAAWVVNAVGQCVEQWTPSSLVRGPTAILMAPTAIPRAVAGAITSMDTLRKDSPSGKSVAAGPLLAFFWGANGFVEMLIWLGTGVADTVTGGALALAPDDAVELSLAPLTYAPVLQPPATDRCGRPLKR